MGVGGRGRGEEARGGVWGIKKKIQDPLLPEKYSQDQGKCGCMLCKKNLKKTGSRRRKKKKKKKKKIGHEYISPTPDPPIKIIWSVAKYCL